MKAKIVTALLFAFVAAGFSGCATNPMAINPKIPMGSKADAAKFADARTVKSKKAYGESVPFGAAYVPTRYAKTTEPRMVIGNLEGRPLVLDSRKEIAQVVASIVANKYPDSMTMLRDFRGWIEFGFWSSTYHVTITAEVVSNGSKVEFKAYGKNTFGTGDVRNFEIPFERALEDLAKQITYAPADLSRVAAK